MVATTDQLVENLYIANTVRTPVPAMHTLAELDHDRAYTIQDRVWDLLWGSGPEAVRGYKISLVTASDQANFSTDRPTCGRLSTAHLLTSPTVIELDSMFCPLVEPELVFRFDEDLSPAASFEEILHKSHVAAGFEVPESRYAGWYPVPDQVVTDLIADNSYAGRVVYGEHTVATRDVDLAAVECRLTIDGELFGTGLGSVVLGNPAMPIVWLSKTLAERGEILRAGSLISSGTFMYPPVARAGLFVAEYSGIGTVSIDFR